VQGQYRHPWFAAFFAFGTTMCVLTIVLLVYPGTGLDSVWRLNPDAHSAFRSFGNWAVLLMAALGTSCAIAAIGLWRGLRWGVQIAVMILSLNIVGDLVNAFARHDYRSLIGVAIGGAMILHLIRANSGSEKLSTKTKDS